MAALVSRRRFLTGLGVAGGAAVLGGAGYGIDTWVTGSSSAPPKGTVSAFRSRPDLTPPTVEVMAQADRVAPGYVFLDPGAGSGQFGPLIMDNLGQPVWFHPVGPSASVSPPALPGPVATNFQATSYQGRPVLTWWEGKVILPGFGQGAYKIYDDRYRKVATVEAQRGQRGDLHEFVITAFGTALLSFYEMVPTDLSSVGGPRRGVLLDSGFQEVDIASGALLFEWRASRNIALNESYNPVSAAGTEAAPWDFFHLNSIDVDTDGHYLISARHTWAVYKLHRTTGAVLWRLNGKQSDYTVSPDAHFSWQHHARRNSDGSISLFDDGAGTFQSEGRSRGLLLALDDTTSACTVLEEYRQLGVDATSSQGSTQMLPNGNAFVGWGSEPYLTEFAHDGSLRFAAQLPVAGVSYRAFRFPWKGTPTERPAVAVGPGENGRPTAYASWNGATEVTAWRALAGSRRDSLQPVARARRTGFETAIALPPQDAAQPFVAVAALDAHGRTLGRSAPYAT
ncbi:MAG TPA: arylsulfotransferase family protein [Acidimicrobiales bacterium]|jgi:hypothetical protein